MATRAIDFPEHPFWDFALAVYRAKGVSAACLNLQERHGIDINLMLFCLWLGESGRGALTETEMLAVMAASDRWHKVVVKGLRLVRRALKDGFADAPAQLRDALRAEVQATEIDAEHLEQLILAGAVDRTPDHAGAPAVERAAHAAETFDHYLRAVDGRFTPHDAVDFAHILGKAFKGLAPDQALDAAEILMR